MVCVADVCPSGADCCPGVWGQSGMRFMTFTSGEDRVQYLKQKRKKRATPKEKKLSDLACSREY